jgi:hypothetical protein
VLKRHDLALRRLHSRDLEVGRKLEAADGLKALAKMWLYRPRLLRLQLAGQRVSTQQRSAYAGASAVSQQ